MERLSNLYGVKATVLPASVLVLLSKYSRAVKDCDGVIIQLSSLNVFKHVHNSFARSSSSSVKRCYRALLRDVNRHLSEGNMSMCPEFVKAQDSIAQTDFNQRENTLYM